MSQETDHQSLTATLDLTGICFVSPEPAPTDPVNRLRDMVFEAMRLPEGAVLSVEGIDRIVEWATIERSSR